MANYLLEPIGLRHKKKYRNLNSFIFSEVEKVWLCNLLIDSIDSSKRKNNKYNFLNKISKRHQLDVQVLKEWIELHKLGETLLKGTCKTRFYNTPLDLLSYITVKKLMNNNEITGHQLNQQIEETCQRKIINDRKRMKNLNKNRIECK